VVAAKTFTPAPSFVGLSLREQMTSAAYALTVVWMVVQSVRMNLFVSLLDDTFAQYGDAARIYTNLYGILVPGVTVLAMPVCGYLLDRHGVIFTLVVTNVLQLLFGACAAVPLIDVQSVTLVLYAAARLLLFGSFFAACVQMFGGGNFGRTSGTASCVANMCCALNIAVTKAVDDSPLLSSQLWILAAISAALALPLFAYPVYLYVLSRRQSAEVRILHDAEALLENAITPDGEE
jgi:hypothetical protein